MEHPSASRAACLARVRAPEPLELALLADPLPFGAGRVRLIRIEELDLQPCGGTHVGRTSEIGPVTVTKIESKGRQNRRIKIILNDNN